MDPGFSELDHPFESRNKWKLAPSGFPWHRDALAGKPRVFWLPQDNRGSSREAPQRGAELEHRPVRASESFEAYPALQASAPGSRTPAPETKAGRGRHHFFPRISRVQRGSA